MAFSTLFPSAAGSATTFNPVGAAQNWDCVNDFAGSDGDTTYVSTFTQNSGDDLYDLQTLASIPAGNTITHVIFYYQTRYNGGSAAQITPKIKHAGVVYNGTTINVTNVYLIYSVSYLTNPLGFPWSLADVNALEVGYSSGALTINELRVTRAYVEVHYSKISPATIMLVSD